jgi:hypothetical protein
MAQIKTGTTATTGAAASPAGSGPAAQPHVGGPRGLGGPQKRALLIGIDKYPNLLAFCQANGMPGACQLNGCAPDAQLMASVLRDKFGFPAANVNLLLNEQATQATILTAMQNLLDATGPDDVVVFHYSGHGSQATTTAHDDPDGLDETIVPSDSGRGNMPNKDIRDNQIYDWLNKLAAKTHFITVIVDACHSGSVTRDIFGGAGRWVAADLRPPPPDAVAAAQSLAQTRDLGTGPSGWVPLGDRYVLFAGCLDAELSNEYPHDGTTNGALTYYLSRQLLQAQPGATYRDVFEPAATQVTAKFPSQHPQLEGARDRELFGVRDIEPMSFVRVTARNGANVTLAAGAAFGVTVGSRWAIYPQGTKTVTAQTPKLGEITITAVRGTSSDGTLADPASQAVAVDSRAIEVARLITAPGLKVEIQAAAGQEAAVQAFTQQLGTSSLVHLAKPGETADARAYLLAPRAAAQAGRDPVPQLIALAAPTWAVVGQDGNMLFPPHGTGEAGVAALLVANLEKIARYRQTLALANPDPLSRLKGRVSFTLKRQAPGGAWADPPTDPTAIPGFPPLAGRAAAGNGGLPLYNDGDNIGAVVTNNSNLPIFVSILDLGLTGAINLYYPLLEGDNQRIEPGQTLEIAMRPGSEVPLGIPDEFRMSGLAGVETLKLIASANPADFSPLVQEGAKDIGDTTTGIGSAVMESTLAAILGRAPRDIRPIQPRTSEDWTTVDRAFALGGAGLR